MSLHTLDDRHRRLWRAATHPSALPALSVLAARKLRRAARGGVAPEAAVPVAHPDRLQDRLPCAPLGAAAPDSVPHLLFQTWKSKRHLPSNYARWRASFLAENPDLTSVLWDDDDNRTFVDEHFPWLRGVYRSFPREIFRVDAVRLLFLFHHGGYYCDLDTECLRPLPALDGVGDVILGRMGPDAGFAHSIPNAIMASKPRQLFWLVAVAMMLEAAAAAGTPERMLALGPEALTGPMLVKAAADFYRGAGPRAARERAAPVLDRLSPALRESVRDGALALLPPETWYPLDWTNPIHRLLRADLLEHRALLTREEIRRVFPRSVLVTYWSHSW